MKRLFFSAACLLSLLEACTRDATTIPPTPQPPKPVDTVVVPKDTTDFYRYLQARNGLPSFLQKLETGGNVVIGYLGGSITEFAGYRVQATEQLQKLYPNTTIKGLNAGVGATGVPLGVYRVDKEVLAYNPDLVFIEFLVNDYTTDSLQLCQGLEGIIRKIRTKNANTDICMLYSVDPNILNDINAANPGCTMRIMERMATYYGIPSINLGVNVNDSLKADRLVFNAPANTNTNGKILFSNDGVHPTTEGHQVYTNTILHCIDTLKKVPRNMAKTVPAAMYAGNYQYARSYAPQEFTVSEGWRKPTDASFDRFKETLPNLLYTDDIADSMVVNIKGTAFGIEEVKGPASAELVITVDGRTQPLVRRFDAASTSNRRFYFVMPYLSNAPHRIVIKLSPNVVDKFAILGTTTPANPAQYAVNHAYVANILALDNP